MLTIVRSYSGVGWAAHEGEDGWSGSRNECSVFALEFSFLPDIWLPCRYLSFFQPPLSLFLQHQLLALGSLTRTPLCSWRAGAKSLVLKGATGLWSPTRPPREREGRSGPRHGHRDTCTALFVFQALSTSEFPFSLQWGFGSVPGRSGLRFD